MARMEPIKIEFDTEALSRFADNMRVIAAALDTALAQSGRQEHASSRLRHKLEELADDMERFPFSADPEHAARLRRILEEEMADHSSTGKEKSEARMEDVNRSTRPGERTLADVLRDQQRSHA